MGNVFLCIFIFFLQIIITSYARYILSKMVRRKILGYYSSITLPVFVYTILICCVIHKFRLVFSCFYQLIWHRVINPPMFWDQVEKWYAARRTYRIGCIGWFNFLGFIGLLFRNLWDRIIAIDLILTSCTHLLSRISVQRGLNRLIKVGSSLCYFNKVKRNQK